VAGIDYGYHFVGLVLDTQGSPALVSTTDRWLVRCSVEVEPELAEDIDYNQSVVQVQRTPDWQSKLSCQTKKTAAAVERNKSIVALHKTVLEHFLCKSSLHHPPHWGHLLLMDTCWIQLSAEAGDCIHRLCADCKYSTNVPRAYGHSTSPQSRALHGDRVGYLGC